MKLIDERFNSEIDSIICTGYYLKGDSFESDELIAHTSLTNSLYQKALETKSEIKDEDLLELVFPDENGAGYVAQWYNLLTGDIEYIKFV